MKQQLPENVVPAGTPRPAAPGPKARASLLYRLLYYPLRRLLLWLFRVRVIGSEHVPAGNYIIAANHLNWVDPFVLLAVLPLEPRTYFIGRRSEVYKSWIRRLVLWAVGGVIPVEPGRGAGAEWSLRDALAVLKQGGVVGIFPEGQVAPEEGRLLPFQRGVGFLAARSGLPVVPIALSGCKELYQGKEITVVIGAPMYVEAGPRMGARDEALVARLQEAMAALLPPYQEPPVTRKRLRFLTKLLG
ncbi:MAG: 1-acyl-sn-glycerol-3-phosphate acyltransferase [Chloroflexi bacterium]|nr:1-acyl-sn-glycerol-3-phosphate acyltransferase [Chloroflexota bacterium]